MAFLGLENFVVFLLLSTSYAMPGNKAYYPQQQDANLPDSNPPSSTPITPEKNPTLPQTTTTPSKDDPMTTTLVVHYSGQSNNAAVSDGPSQGSYGSGAYPQPESNYPLYNGSSILGPPGGNDTTAASTVPEDGHSSPLKSSNASEDAFKECNCPPPSTTTMRDTVTMQSTVTVQEKITAPAITTTSTSTVTVTATTCAGSGQNTGTASTGSSDGFLQDTGQQLDEGPSAGPEDSDLGAPVGSRPIDQIPSGAPDPYKGNEDTQSAPDGGMIPLPDKPLSTGNAGSPPESADMNSSSVDTGSGSLIEDQSPTSGQQTIPSMSSLDSNGTMQNPDYGSAQDVQNPEAQEGSIASAGEDVDVSTTGSNSDTSISSTDDYLSGVPSNGSAQNGAGSETNGDMGQPPSISDSNDNNENGPDLGSSSLGAGSPATNSSSDFLSHDDDGYRPANSPSDEVMSNGDAGQGTGHPAQSNEANPAISGIPPSTNASSTTPPAVEPGPGDAYQPNADGIPLYQSPIVSSPMPSPTSHQSTTGTRVTSTKIMEVYPEPVATSSGDAQPPLQSDWNNEGIYGDKDDSIPPAEDGSSSLSGDTSMPPTESSDNGTTHARPGSQISTPDVPVSNSTSQTSQSPPISSPIPGNTSSLPPGDSTQRLPQDSAPASLPENSQPCVPKPVNKYLQASFDILDPALPMPSPYLYLAYSGFNLNPQSPSPHLISQPSKDSPTVITVGADAEHFNLTSVALACAEPPCKVTMWGVKVQGKTAQGAASGSLLTKSVDVGVSEEGADEYVTVEGLDKLGWVHLEKVSFVGKKVGSGEDEPPAGVGLDDVLYHVMTRGECTEEQKGIEGAQALKEPKTGDEGNSEGTEGNENKGDESKGNESNGDEAKGNEANGDESKGNEGKGNEANGDEAKGNEKNGDEDNGDEAKGNEGNGDESKGDESKGNEANGNEKNGDELNGKEDQGDEAKGNESNGNEDKGKEDQGDEDKGKEDQGDEAKGNEDKGDEDKGNEKNGDEWKGNGQAGQGKRFKRRGRMYNSNRLRHYL
ncbi:MAG: hypothetical protein Q9174_005430 [Haloplaca sp. 1 TL-2023]